LRRFYQGRGKLAATDGKVSLLALTVRLRTRKPETTCNVQVVSGF
jgi:hypothetical protein